MSDDPWWRTRERREEERGSCEGGGEEGFLKASRRTGVPTGFNSCTNRFSVLKEESAQSSSLYDETTPYMPTPREEEVRATGRNALKLAIVVITIDTNQKMKVDALLDSGATGSFVDDGLVKEQGWNTMELERPRMVANMDGTLNVAGSVRRTIDLMVNIGEHQERMTFAVTNLGNNRIILGHDWLK